MVDDATTGAAAPEIRCMWCSAILPSAHETTCPSCGATLVGEGESSVPGLTAIDADAILRSARAGKTKPRGRLLSWISGEYNADDPAAHPAPGSLAPPPVEVRREMLRLELEAQVANAQAEVEAMAADAAVEGGTSLAAFADQPPTAADAAPSDAPDGADAAPEPAASRTDEAPPA
jgi:hypothetical protein